MDGIRLHKRIHDENAGTAPVLANNKPVQQGSSGSLMAPGPLSARKAFGNITNKSQQQQDASGGGAGAGAVKPRRALGELSTNKPAQQQGAPGPSAAKPRQAQPQPALQQKQQDRDLAACYAASGVERAAGKTWRQMEDARDAEEEAAAAAAARQLTAKLAGWRVGGGGGGIFKVQSDDEDELLAPQRPRQQVAAARRPFGSLARGFSIAGEEGGGLLG
jgi:hypothetical protein